MEVNDYITPITPPVMPNWEVLPQETLQSLSTLAKTRQKSLAILIALEGISISASCTVIAFKASVLVLTGCSLLTGVVSIALVSYGIYLYCRGHLESREGALKSRCDAGPQIEQQSYPVIYATYKVLLDRKIITFEELNMILRKDLAATNYTDFIKKHTKGIVPILNKDNSDLLELKRKEQCDEILKKFYQHHYDQYKLSPNYIFRYQNNFEASLQLGCNLTEEEFKNLEVTDEKITETSKNANKRALGKMLKKF